MRRTKGLIIGLVACMAALSAVSCSKKDNTLLYNNVTMGNIVDGTFTSDQGNIFNVVEQNCTGKLDTMKRAFTICDVLNMTEGTENGYDVRLNYVADVFTKNAKPASEIDDMDLYMNDPLIVRDAWISGGYLNLFISISVKQQGGQPHEINLIHSKLGNKYIFNIRHDAAGEILKEDGDNAGIGFAYGYVSFPISSIIEENSALIEIEWNSYVYSGSFVSAKTIAHKITRDYTKGGFEQVPSTVVKTKAALNIR